MPDTMTADRLLESIRHQRDREQAVRQSADAAVEAEAAKLDRLLQQAIDHPDIAVTKVAEMLGVSRDFVYKRVTARRDG